MRYLKQRHEHSMLDFIMKTVMLPISMLMTTALPASVAFADEANGYSVGTPVTEENEWYHSYSYVSRDFSEMNLPVEMREEDVSGMQVFVLASSFEGDMSSMRKILFVHGGAFVGQLSTTHIWMAANLAKASHSIVYLPAYPTASYYSDYKDTYPPMLDLYRAVADHAPEDRFFVIGDSAGGGLALGLCQAAAKDDGLRQPKELILVSPWADVTVQPWAGLDEAARLWTGSAKSQKNAKVSPAYGSMAGLGHVTIYNGELDGLSESIEKLYYRIRGKNVACKLITTRDIGHDYLFMLPNEAANRTFNLICASIVGRLSPQNDDMAWVEMVSTTAFDNGRQATSPTPQAVSQSPMFEGK